MSQLYKKLIDIKCGMNLSNRIILKYNFGGLWKRQWENCTRNLKCFVLFTLLRLIKNIVLTVLLRFYSKSAKSIENFLNINKEKTNEKYIISRKYKF